MCLFHCCVLTSRILPTGFSKTSFLPLLEFAYTSTLTFNFCVMADIATLARHLLMTEVLQICESVHKQVEEQKLTVYQKGDVHTVVSTHMSSQDEVKNESGEYMVAIHSDGSNVLTQSAAVVAGEALAFVESSGKGFIEQPLAFIAEAVEGVHVHRGEEDESETVTLIAPSEHVKPGETVTLISHSTEGMEGETMTVVTHSGQAGASESLAVVSACLAMEQPQTAEGEASVIDVDLNETNPPDVTKVESVAAETSVLPPNTPDVAPAPQKRKRGRPAKVKKPVEMEEVVPLAEEEGPAFDESLADKQEMASDDPNRRRLRQRSIGEGGYVRLHMGLENEEEAKMGTSPLRTAPAKVCCLLKIHCLLDINYIFN